MMTNSFNQKGKSMPRIPQKKGLELNLDALKTNVIDKANKQKVHAQAKTPRPNDKGQISTGRLKTPS